MKEFLKINPADSVAVALQPLGAGFVANVDGEEVTLSMDIPAGHKFALCDIAEGEDIIKYGYPIGHAMCAVRKGELLDHHNIRTNLCGTLDYSGIRPLERKEKREEEKGEKREEEKKGHFLGYVRPDGQVGIRNDIWVIPTVGCVNGICRQIVERTRAALLPPTGGAGEGLAYFPHTYGCSQLGDDHENTRKILRDMVMHPNVGGVLVIGLGCENNQPKDFEAMLGDYDRKRIRFMVCQEVEGDEVEAGVAIVKELYAQAQTFERKQAACGPEVRRFRRFLRHHSQPPPWRFHRLAVQGAGRHRHPHGSA